jgi:hypothetical protein
MKLQWLRITSVCTVLLASGLGLVMILQGICHQVAAVVASVSWNHPVM